MRELACSVLEREGVGDAEELLRNHHPAALICSAENMRRFESWDVAPFAEFIAADAICRDALVMQFIAEAFINDLEGRPSGLFEFIEESRTTLVSSSPLHSEPTERVLTADNVAGNCQLMALKLFHKAEYLDDGELEWFAVSILRMSATVLQFLGSIEDDNWHDGMYFVVDDLTTKAQLISRLMTCGESRTLR